ncbi:hypothetical protein CKJ70_11525 [Mycobacterium avium]|nr:hypothetical protein CKJ70_11525 [Mycobacterium avium]
MIGPTDFQIILGKVRPLSRPHPEAHPQVLIIAQTAVASRSTRKDAPQGLALSRTTGPLVKLAG